MNADAVETLLARIDRLEVALVATTSTAPVLGVAEACALSRHGSESAFYRWAKTWGVKPCGQGRYARRAILAGLERETNGACRRRRALSAKKPTTPQTTPHALAT